MAVGFLKPNVYFIGAIDWNRRLFDELISLPDGTSYNFYLIRGSNKTALIDTVDPAKEYDLINNLKNLNVKKIDYVISNHAEQDHSGTIPKILELYPEAKVLTNQKCGDLFVKNEAIIIYVSMHGNTERMIHYLTGSLIERGIDVKPFNLTLTDLDELAIALVDAATLVVASPAFLVGPHPLVLYTVHLINSLRPKTKFVAITGTYGWGEKIEERIREGLKNLKAEFITSLIIRGHPKENDFKSLEKFVEEIYRRHKELNLIQKGV